MRISFMLVASAITVLTGAARAEPISGLYVAAGAGLNIMQDETESSVNGIASPGKKLEAGLGAIAVASVGWGFGNGLRAELEFDYRYNPLNKKFIPESGDLSITGAEQKFGP